jgi:hypothetical protein
MFLDELAFPVAVVSDDPDLLALAYDGFDGTQKSASKRSVFRL